MNEQSKNSSLIESNTPPKSSEEKLLRLLLAVRVCMPQTYFDDGEAYGQEHGISIDFMRDSASDIDAKLQKLNVARWDASLDSSKSSSITSSSQYQLYKSLTEYFSAADSAWAELCEEVSKRGITYMPVLPAQAKSIEKFNNLRRALCNNPDFLLSTQVEDLKIKLAQAEYQRDALQDALLETMKVLARLDPKGVSKWLKEQDSNPKL